MEEEEEKGQVEYVGEWVGMSSLLFGGMADLFGRGGMGYRVMGSKNVEEVNWPRVRERRGLNVNERKWEEE